MMKKRSMDATEDRISKLPEPILQKILCLLPYAKDVARLSTLSKALNNAWSSLSYLNFGYYFFYHREDDGLIHSENIRELVNVVDQTLAKRQKHKISIQKFWLKLPSCHWSSYVHSWIKTLAALNIKELCLSVPKPDDGYNTLPEHIFAAKELNVLDLSGFKLELPPDGIKFSFLQKLSLYNTFLDDHFIRAICESCPGLENISLINIHGLTSFQTAGTLPKLRGVWLICLNSEFKMVDIVAPNLGFLFIDCNVYCKLQVIKVTACKALKNLFLCGVGVTGDWLEDLFSSLPYLEDLSLESCAALKTIKISSDRLKYLKVKWCYNLIVAELDTPNLKRFSCNCSFGYHQLPALKLKASVSLRVDLFLSGPTSFLPEPTPDSQWYSELMKFLGSFNMSKAIDLVCKSGNAVVIPKDRRKNLVPPLYGTDCLRIEIKSAKNYSLEDVIDSLLWICPQLDTLCLVRNEDLECTLKFIYDDASEEDQKTCCASLPLKCWRHKLKEVNMENFTLAEKQELRNYFFTNVSRVDLIDVSQ